MILRSQRQILTTGNNQKITEYKAVLKAEYYAWTKQTTIRNIEYVHKLMMSNPESQMGHWYDYNKAFKTDIGNFTFGNSFHLFNGLIRTTK
jgi:hypothetical protein